MGKTTKARLNLTIDPDIYRKSRHVFQAMDMNMSAFMEIGLHGSAGLAVVAPGIAEALINTAAGLGAALPAVIGYNYLVTQIKRLAAEMDDFSLEFVSITERNFTE